MSDNMSDNSGAWIVSPAERYNLSYSYRGGESRFTILNSIFEGYRARGHDLIFRIKASPFGQLYTALENYRFSSPVVHQLTLRMVYPIEPNQIRFKFGNTICRFGKVDFAIMTGLNFGPEVIDTRGTEERINSSLILSQTSTSDVDLRRTPFKCKVGAITIKVLESALKSDLEHEVAYQLGLLYFIEGVLHGKTNIAKVSADLFYMVEDLSRFYSYTWGAYFWNITLNELKKISTKLRSRIGMSNTSTDIQGLIPALQYWAYEMIPKLGAECGTLQGSMIPRVLRWHCKTLIRNANVIGHIDNFNEDICYLQPSKDELESCRFGLSEEEITPSPVFPIPLDGPPPPTEENRSEIAALHQEIAALRQEIAVGAFATAENQGEIAALRQEIAALRQEFVVMRNEHSYCQEVAPMPHMPDPPAHASSSSGPHMPHPPPQVASHHQVPQMSLGENETDVGTKNKEVDADTSSPEKGRKRVKFAENNLIWHPENPLPPQNLRMPPAAKPRGSALKKGVPPGPLTRVTRNRRPK